MSQIRLLVARLIYERDLLYEAQSLDRCAGYRGRSRVDRLISRFRPQGQAGWVQRHLEGALQEAQAAGNLAALSPLLIAARDEGERFLSAIAEGNAPDWQTHCTAVNRLVEHLPVVEKDEVRDPTAYVPATPLACGSFGGPGFDSYKSLKSSLDGHPEIRTWSPRPQRLCVHAGDWIWFWEREAERKEEAAALLSDRNEAAAGIVAKRLKGVDEAPEDWFTQ